MKGSPNEMPKDACYFLTFNVIDWVSLFTRPDYKRVIVNSLNYFVQVRGLTVYSWCLMTNHLHLLAKTEEGYTLASFEKEFKKHTTPELLELLAGEPGLRKEWMLRHFEDFSKSLRKLEKHRLWQDCSSPIHIDHKQPERLQERIDYIHENPIRDLVTDLPENYLFSSARDYAGLKGLVHVKVIRQASPKLRNAAAN